MKNLSIIMPVYNEGEVITYVLEDWLKELRQLNINFEICVYNDGSRDNTLNEINKIALNNNEIKVFDKTNSGHGPTILSAYLESSSKWIFQTDSDNEIKPNEFYQLWNKRNDNDFIIGIRTNRNSPLSRKIISFFSRLTIRLLYGKGVIDVNCPYRLFRNEKFAKSLKKMSKNTIAPNVIISGIACSHNMKIIQIPVEFKPRSTGEVSIQKWKLIKVAIQSWLQTVGFRIKVFMN